MELLCKFVLTVLIVFLWQFRCIYPTLIWSDEFNEPQLNLEKWSFDTSPPSNHELELYTNRSTNVFLKDGHLVIQALQEYIQDHNYTSGRIFTQYKADFLYCRIEIRAKLPYGRGLWPAIWMLPTYHLHGPGIASGEMDIMELLGHEPNKMYTTVHFGKNWTDRSKKNTNYTLPHGNFSDGFHVFAMDWMPGLIKFFVDDVKILTFTPSDVAYKYIYPFDDYFYIILNVAVGGDWPGSPDHTTKFPQKMLVDYVRVYDTSKRIFNK